jgi:type VI secretion system secreted protein Hcp
MPIFMKFEGITGPVTYKGEKGWIQLESCQLGVGRGIPSPIGNSGNRESSVPQIHEIVITKFQDSSSTGLFTEALSGIGKKVTIEFVNGKEAPYLSIDLESVMISSYSISGGGSDKPMESFSINFTKATYTVKEVSSSKDPKDNKDKAGWNYVTK